MNIRYSTILSTYRHVNYHPLFATYLILAVITDLPPQAFTVKTNDQNLVMYSASIIRAVIALHSLINNKTTNCAAEKEGSKKVRVS